MAGEKVDFDKAKAKPTADAPRAQSTIEFPNNDLDSAVTIARHVYDRSGLGKCPLDELAAQAGVTMSGNFRNRNAAAKLFGFIEKDGQSAVKLTDLGARVVSAKSEADARATAFLNVPLYSGIFEKYRGKLLPPSKALEREMVTLGVIPTMATPARQIMQRSARQAGFSVERRGSPCAPACYREWGCGRNPRSGGRRRASSSSRGEDTTPQERWWWRPNITHSSKAC